MEPKEVSSLSVTTSVLNPSVDTWEKIGQEILKIEKAAFGGKKAFRNEVSQSLYENPENIYVLMRDESGEAIGCTFATRIYDPEVPAHHNPQIRQDDKETAYIMSTGFLPQYQRKRLVVPLLNTLEEELRKRGYESIERDADKASGYADSLIKNNPDRIIEYHDRLDPVYGLQVCIRMRL